ncbi:kinase-like domain-containing protein [Rhizophagus irregularis DAOM 181602=DAOM 197198]|nr:kinase-like domain-containing protein [Rhizophagus irregularis DAOM 181602=DAOM 197198]
MSDKYLNELKIHWEIANKSGLQFYGFTKDPETKEFMMIIIFADEGNLRSILSNNFNNIMWEDKIKYLTGNKDNNEEYGYKGNEIKAAFEEADKEIPNISTSYEKNSDAVYTSRAFTFSNLLSKPVNSSIITSYVNNEVCDSQLIDLEVSNSIQL